MQPSLAKQRDRTEIPRDIAGALRRPKTIRVNSNQRPGFIDHPGTHQNFARASKTIHKLFKANAKLWTLRTSSIGNNSSRPITTLLKEKTGKRPRIIATNLIF
ncbi:hypothetical protein [Synechococcus sp. MIT S9504]|uniref:hypothetical protein n=1 Tax=Synechococcus sp. MIT S9504 TaxID=1801628 RepID=UPI0018D3C7E1|nr:hypothetical protein [Synechococcus sp. MIT S9504]